MRFESFHYIGLASTGYEHGLYIHTSYFIYPRTFKVALTANVTEHFNNTTAQWAKIAGNSMPYSLR